MPFTPSCITERKNLTDTIRKEGYKYLFVSGFESAVFNEIMFRASQDWVLGSSSQVTAGDGDIYYDSGVFRDANADPVTLAGFDRITVILTTLTESITFPAVQLDIKNHEDLSMDSFNVTIQGVITGSLSITGTGVFNMAGQSNMLILNRVTSTLNKTGTGLIIDNGVAA